MQKNKQWTRFRRECQQLLTLTLIHSFVASVCYIIYLTLIMFKLICFALLSLVAATPITPTPTPEAEKVLAALVS